MEYDYELSETDWEKIFDEKKKCFVKKTYIDYFSSKLAEVTPCSVICFNKYVGRNTWTVEFRCKRCKREYKFLSKVEKKFQLLSISVDANCDSATTSSV